MFPIHCHAALSKTKSQKRVVILREAKRSRRIYWRTIELSFRVKWNGIAESIEEPSNCHSARSNAESQNLIVILREAKRSRRIYWKTIELSFCVKWNGIAESLLYQNISKIHLKLNPLSSISSLIFKFSYEHSKIPNRFFFNWFSDLNDKNRCSESFSWQNC